MTHAVALTGQWGGLRAVPRTLRTPTHRCRLENGLDRLGTLYERMRHRAERLNAGLARLDGLRAGMIDQLDAIDGDADFEPSLSAALPLLHPAGSQDAWLQGPDDDREAEHDGREPDADFEPDNDDEASLVGSVGTIYEHAVGGQATLCGLNTVDLESQCEDEGHDSDREPEEHA